MANRGSTLKMIALVILVVIGIILFKSDMLKSPFASLVDLKDPTTNSSYTCSTVADCYTKVPNLPATGVKLGCKDEKCVELGDCKLGESEKITCWDNSEITVRDCVNNYWEFTAESCPPYECKSHLDCKMESDVDCDEEMELVTGTCSAHRCDFPSENRCTNLSLFWGKYKLWIVFLIMLSLGAYAFWEKGSREGFFKQI